MPHQAVPVSRTGIKIEFPAAERRLDFLDQPVRVGSMDVSGTIIRQGLFLVNRVVRQGHEITAQRYILIRELNTDIRGFQRRPSGIAILRVITQNR